MTGSLRVVRTLVKMSVLQEMQYRVNFFLSLIQSMIALGTGLVVLALVFDQVNELHGWSRPELLLVMGVFTLMGGVVQAVIAPNMTRLMQDIQNGTFDFTLTKPVGAQLFSSFQAVQIWQGTDIAAGLVVIVVAIVQLGGRLEAAAVVGFVVLLLLGAVIIYCVWMLLTTTAFWVVQIEQIADLFDGLFQAGRWPIVIYPGWLRIGLTFVVPIGFAITVPAQALTGRLSIGAWLLAVGLAVVLSVVTRWYFRLGLRRYSGASA
ncbi:ABC-2 type transport system permease protein [Nakamurella panacisegetis]|uniref:ABC-2 type transport system permease protein n=1 Tax=Nakamurella panacisegetis TaxID=1090615 RepID=A0A1H0PGU6_9ACTN|nr:ABC-2 family transporter protein [Nakamurella panacisegetis]SDP03990.1 ABC-2 type transport system permease protein [Nakamurella panacisegetis]